VAETPILYPLNDLSVAMGPFETVTTLGVHTPITAGTISGFLATTDAPDAIAADATLAVANLSYIGGQPKGDGTNWAAGWWLIQFDAAVLTAALLNTLFAARGEAFIHAISAGNVRVVVRVEYRASRYSVMV